MFKNKKGPTRKQHEQHAEEAWKNLQWSKGPGDKSVELGRANAHATLAVYTLLRERLPVPPVEAEVDVE